MKFVFPFLLVASILLLTTDRVNNHKHKTKIKVSVILGILLFSIIFLGGFRPTPIWASKATSFIGSDDKLMSEQVIDDVYFHTYYNDAEKVYRTTVSRKSFFLYASRESMYYERLESDAIEMCGFSNFLISDKVVYYLNAKSYDDRIAAIVIDGDEDMTYKFDEAGEVITFFNSGKDYVDLDILAVDDMGLPLYYFGYPKGANRSSMDDLKWHEYE